MRHGRGGGRTLEAPCSNARLHQRRRAYSKNAASEPLRPCFVRRARNKGPSEASWAVREQWRDRQLPGREPSGRAETRNSKAGTKVGPPGNPHNAAEGEAELSCFFFSSFHLFSPLSLRCLICVVCFASRFASRRRRTKTFIDSPRATEKKEKRINVDEQVKTGNRVGNTPAASVCIQSARSYTGDRQSARESDSAKLACAVCATLPGTASA